MTSCASRRRSPRGARPRNALLKAPSLAGAPFTGCARFLFRVARAGSVVCWTAPRVGDGELVSAPEETRPLSAQLNRHTTRSMSMTRHLRAFALAGAAGLAVSATARAQFTIVNNRPGTFTDISATGTAITSGDDSSAPFTSAVTNPLVTNASLFASTNGNVTDAQFAVFGNGPLPVGGLNFGLFPLWDDLYVDAPSTLIHPAVVEGGINVEIIQWSRVRTFAAGPSGPRGSFQIKIFASGPVFAQFIYDDISFAGNGDSATVGFQVSAANFEQFSFNTASIPNGS